MRDFTVCGKQLKGNNMNVKKELQKLETELDAEFGKVKRLLMQGWMSKPAWARACVWILFGAVTALVLR